MTGKTKPRCPKCGAFSPTCFIFLPGHVPKVIEYDCGKCGAHLECVRTDGEKHGRVLS
jgi:DNA-directed RNA polymerase subunit RPC12/RpoP